MCNLSSDSKRACTSSEMRTSFLHQLYRTISPNQVMHLINFFLVANIQPRMCLIFSKLRFLQKFGSHISIQNFLSSYRLFETNVILMLFSKFVLDNFNESSISFFFFLSPGKCPMDWQIIQVG